MSTNDLQRVKSADPVKPTPVAAASSSVEFNTDNGKPDGDLMKENEALKLEVEDLKAKLDTLKMKRAEDRDKVRELEKAKLQIQQV